MGEGLIVRRGMPKITQMFYDSGNEFVSVTGGWVTGYTTGGGTQSKESGYLSFSTYGMPPTVAYGNRTYVTSYKIDLTNISKLFFEFEKSGDASSGNITLRVGNNSNGDNDLAMTSVSNPTTGKTVASFDVSNLTSSYYICVMLSALTAQAVTGKVYRIWGEKQ